MNTEDLFKYGVTPKEGERKGERFRVLSISEKGIAATDWNRETGVKYNLTHGGYDLWQEPKTLFQDPSVEPTWGNLKKAMEAAGLPDDTLFVVPGPELLFLREYGWPAVFRMEMLRQPYEKPKKHIVVYGK